MGIMGELFPSQKLRHDGSETGDGQDHRPRLDVDLDAGVIRLSGPSDPAPTDERA
ncbi:hypothetical protein [Nocardia asteroides]|uniref:hypothetical protein n=1 Tax=Nocardia asteroides TaxID=1824 RepID=UPI003439184D